MAESNVLVLQNRRGCGRLEHLIEHWTTAMEFVSSIALRLEVPGEGLEVILQWPNDKSFLAFRKAACTTFGFDSAQLTDYESRAAISSETEFRRMLADWAARERARETDVLVAWSLRVSQKIASPPSREDGMHALWELACRPSNHAAIGPEMLHAALVAIEGHPGGGAADSVALGTSFFAAAAVWMLAQAPQTRQRLPVKRLVAALLRSLEQPAVPGADSDSSKYALAAAGALSCLLHDEAAQAQLRAMNGEILLVGLLSREPKELRSVGASALCAVCSANPALTLAVADAGGMRALLEVALGKDDPTAVRLSAVLTLAAFATGFASQGFGHPSPLHLTGGAPHEAERSLTKLIERLAGVMAGFVHVLHPAASLSSAAVGASERGVGAGDDDRVLLLSGILGVIWHLLAFAPALAKDRRTTEMVGVGDLLLRVLVASDGWSELVPPCCGAMGLMLPAELPSGA